MKNNWLFAGALLFSLVSCSIKNGEMSINSLSLDIKEGREKPVTKSYSGDFDEIRVSQSLDARIVKSNEEKVEVFAPADLQQYILVENDNGKLHVHLSNNVNISLKDVKIKIFANDFSKLSADSSSDVTLNEGFNFKKLTVEASSSADISGSVRADELDISTSSSAGFDGEVFGGDLKASANSSSGIDLKGKVNRAVFDASSSADITADKLEAKIVEAEASSSAGISASASESVSASATSSADITVYKKGTLRSQHVKESSSGSVTLR